MIRASSDKHQVALVAHDALKTSLVDWVGEHLALFQQASIFSTGTTGGLLRKKYPSLEISALKSGPLGGDQQIGAMICEGQLDALIFFVDPLSPMPHDVDVKALTRLATVYDIPLACNPATANLVAAGFQRGHL